MVWKQSVQAKFPKRIEERFCFLVKLQAIYVFMVLFMNFIYILSNPVYLFKISEVALYHAISQWLLLQFIKNFIYKRKVRFVK